MHTNDIAPQDPIKFFGTISKFLRLLKESGLSAESAVHAVVDNREVREKLVNFWGTIAYSMTPSQKNALARLGPNFFGVDEWYKYFNIIFSPKQLEKIAEFPWDQKVLDSKCPICGERVKDCHFAFMGLDIDYLKFNQMIKIAGGERRIPVGMEYAGNADARDLEKLRLQWYLLHIETTQNKDKWYYGKQIRNVDIRYEGSSILETKLKNSLHFIKAKSVSYNNSYGMARDIRNQKHPVVFFGSVGEKNFRFLNTDEETSYGYGLNLSRKHSY